MGQSSQQLEFVGTSAWSVRTRQQIASLAQRSQNVLITGPAGSGKKLIARALHTASDRIGHPLVQVDCRSLTPLVAASQLFGHERGGVPFATGAALGCLRTADGGTLVLDGIEYLDSQTQVRLRESLGIAKVTPLGATEPVSIDLQVVTTSQCDLAGQVLAGYFDRGLLELLSGATLETVPLEERLDDIVALAEHFLAGAAFGSRKFLSASALNWLRSNRWPGNMHELKQLMDRAAELPQNTIDFAALRSLHCAMRLPRLTAIPVRLKRFWGFAALRAADRRSCAATSELRCNRHFA